MSRDHSTALMNSPRTRAISSLRVFLERSGLRVGDRLPAESKLAAQFDVSRMTLRSALDALEREGMIRRERNLGCFCAIQPKAEESLMSRTVVLLTDHLSASNGHDFGGTSASIVSGVIDCAGRNKMHFLRINTDMDVDQAIEQLVSARPAGVVISIWNRPIQWQLDVADRLTTHNVHVVVGTESQMLDPFDTVKSDHVGGAAQLTRKMAERGRKNILRFWAGDQARPFIQSRNLGFEIAAKELGLKEIPPIYMTPVSGIPIDNIQSAQEFDLCVRHVAGYLIEHLRAGSQVDAIMTTADTDAMVVIEACRLLGRTDIVVTGYDNRWKDNQTCPWTHGLPWMTVDKNNHQIGEEMVNLLIERIDGKLPPKPQKRLVAQVIIEHTESTKE